MAGTSALLSKTLHIYPTVSRNIHRSPSVSRIYPYVSRIYPTVSRNIQRSPSVSRINIYYWGGETKVSAGEYMAGYKEMEQDQRKAVLKKLKVEIV